MNCVVFKLDERLHEKLIKFYKAYEIKPHHMLNLPLKTMM